MNSIGKIENRSGDAGGFRKAVAQAVRYYRDAERDLRLQPLPDLAAIVAGGSAAARSTAYYAAEVGGPEGMLGRWSGPGAAALGLTGPIDEKTFSSVLEGRDPRTGQELGSRSGRERVVAFDVAFSLPKSVSLLYALTDQGRVRDTILAALWEGGQASAAYLQANAGWARRHDPQKDHVVPVRAQMVQAQFVHRLARPVRDPATEEVTVDPQLHLHTIIPARVLRDDGRWSHLYSEPLYDHAATAGAIGQAVVRDILVRELGLEVEVLPNATFELRGITEKQRREFSRRSQQIEAAEREHGVDSLLGHKIAVEDTRESKDEIDEILLRGLDVYAEIRRRAVAVGLSTADADALVGRLAEPIAERGLDAAPEEILGAEGLTKESATFARRHLIRSLAAHAPLGSGSEELQAMADRILADPTLATRMNRIWRADASALAGNPQASGRYLPVEQRYSTPEMAEVERAMLESAATRNKAGVGAATEREVRSAIARRERSGERGLTADQKAMIEAVTLSPAGVVVIEGAAGVGKTTALDAAREALEASGVRVIGGALAGRWAQEMQEAASIPSFTLASLFDQLEQERLAPNSVLVVDEAGMVGSRQLAKLVEISARDNAKLVLVGDSKQLQPIDAGAGFRALGDRLGKTVVKENVRQLQAPEWQRLAAVALREGHGTEAFHIYRDNGGVRVSETAWARKQQMVADFVEAVKLGRNPLMMARARSDVDDLNALARGAASAEGWLQGDELAVGERRYAIGDQVLCLRNRRRKGLTNGLRGRVVGIDHEQRILELETADGQRLPIHTDDYGHLDYGYALTKTKSMGGTADIALEMASEGASAEETYVGITRQRCDAIYYTVAHPRPKDVDGVHHASGTERAVEERYRRAWTRWQEKDSTLDYQDGASADAPSPARTLKPRSAGTDNPIVRLPDNAQFPIRPSQNPAVWRQDFRALAAVWSEIERAWLDPMGDCKMEAISHNWWSWQPKFERLLGMWAEDWHQLEPEDRKELGMLAAGGALAMAGTGDDSLQPEDALRFVARPMKSPETRTTLNGAGLAEESASRSTQSSNTKPVALLLNDREDESETVAAVLGRAGYEVRATRSMDEAIGIAGDDDLDVAVIDWRLTESWREVGWLEDRDPAALIPEPTSSHLLRLLNAARPKLPVVVHAPDAGSLQLAVLIQRQHPHALVINTERAAVELPEALDLVKGTVPSIYEMRAAQLIAQRDRGENLKPSELRELGILRAHLRGEDPQGQTLAPPSVQATKSANASRGR